MAAHVKRMRHLQHASHLTVFVVFAAESRLFLFAVTYTAVGVEVGVGSSERGGGAGRWLVHGVDEEVESAGVSGRGYENLLLQGCGKAHVGAAVCQLSCGVEAEGEEGESVPDQMLQ